MQFSPGNDSHHQHFQTNFIDLQPPSFFYFLPSRQQNPTNQVVAYLFSSRKNISQKIMIKKKLSRSHSSSWQTHIWQPFFEEKWFPMAQVVQGTAQFILCRWVFRKRKLYCIFKFILKLYILDENVFYPFLAYNLQKGRLRKMYKENYFTTIRNDKTCNRLMARCFLRAVSVDNSHQWQEEDGRGYQRPNGNICLLELKQWELDDCVCCCCCNKLGSVFTYMYMSVCASVCVCLFTHCTHFAIVWQKKKKRKMPPFCSSL